ncbi:hypothetical protein CERZMDRAFT_98491 [Cercospora zeae-maydis SCOH1-5]|uniref:Uncharacterized protein n=1 Tax=Cercospora zeae-maydis SCOH1-5 TaxID=717836 RepID=A0A6A6FDS8_9PEZI|nr:hypothetical protein CERZMDRAFT_98491 [Cercospora zeae-maydis SCOH1-5]
MFEEQGDAGPLATYHEYVDFFEDEERAWRLFLDSRFKWPTADGDTRVLGHPSSCRRNRHALPPSVAFWDTRETAKEARGPQRCQNARRASDSNAGGRMAEVESARELDRADSITAIDNEVEDNNVPRGIVWVVRKRSIAIIKNAILKRTSLNDQGACSHSSAREASRNARPRKLKHGQPQHMQPKQRSIFPGYLFGEKIAQQQRAVADTEGTTNADRHEKRKASRALSGIFADKTQLIVKKLRKKGDEQHNPGENAISGAYSAKVLMPDDATIVASTGNSHPSSQQLRITDDDTSPAHSRRSAVEEPIKSEAELSGSEYASALEELQPLIACPATTGRISQKNAVVEKTSTNQCRQQMPVLQPAETALTPKNFKTSPAEMALYGRNLVVAVERQAKKGCMDSERVEQRFDRIFRRLEADDAAHQESVQRQYLADVEAERCQRNRKHWAAMREWESKGRPVEDSWRCGGKAKPGSSPGNK